MVLMTTVDIQFRYATQPTEQVAVALASVRDVYGIRRLSMDRPAHTLLVEYDATRLSASVVTKLVFNAGVDIVEELSLIPAQPPEPAPAPVA